MAMLVGLSVGVNEFQRVLNAFKVLVIIMLQGIKLLDIFNAFRII